MNMDTLMKEMVEYCKVAQTQARRSLEKCDQALAQCTIARQHLDNLRLNNLRANHSELKGAKK